MTIRLYSKTLLLVGDAMRGLDNEPKYDSQIDIQSVDPNSLTDINDVKVNKHLPREKRIVEFLRQIKNPYCFRCGKVVVKASFSQDDVTLENRFENFLKML